MDKIKIKKVDEEIYHETLDNGLNVYIYKKQGFSKKGAFFATNYGSAINDFKPIDEDEIRSFPHGIAHFLEHKLFESNDNEKTFEKFSKYGADVNAYTNHNITNYYFSTIDNFEECLNELLDFVQKPHFTDENVEKEKGIINQEINMTSDNIDRLIFEEAYDAALVNNPNKYKTIGEKESVNSITKEDLYKCYNTFYHPSNMILFIYGDIDINNTLNIVIKNQASKKYVKEEKLEIKKYVEDKKVSKEKVHFKRNINIPKVMLCYKIKIPLLNGKEKYKKALFINMLLDVKFGGASSFEKDLLNKGIIEDYIGYTSSLFDDVILIFIESKTKYKDKFIKLVDKKIKEEIKDDKIFELNKKSYITSLVRVYENPSMVGNVIISNINKYKDIIKDAYDIYNNYSFDEFNGDFNELNFDNKSVIYVSNKEE